MHSTLNVYYIHSIQDEGEEEEKVAFLGQKREREISGLNHELL